MNEEFITVHAADIESPDAYRLLTGAVVPRPVAWITTVDADGRSNAAPFSAYNFVAHSPPMVAVNIASRGGELKDTARNIRDSGEFVVNVATVDTLDLMHASAAEFEADVSEPETLGIELLPSDLVRAPRIACSPVQMECRLDRWITLGTGVNTLYIGEVVAFHMSSRVYDGRYIDSAKLQPIARLAGPNYALLGEIVSRKVHRSKTSMLSAVYSGDESS
jgi:flavin reductase (DIM6/NTAB) family NADH-FMN oxidoreductase RutF